MLSVHLRHAFPGFQLQADFEAPPGVTALFGRSGSGKTTIVNAVAGLLRPDAGRICAGGEVLLDTARGVCLAPHRRRIGYVFQEGRLFPHLTVMQNLRYGRMFAPRAARAAAGAAMEPARIIDLLGLGALLARRPAALSGGEKQRVALGRAILSCPRLLLLDEPLAALDLARKAEILPWLVRLRDELALPMLYVSHAPAEVAQLATTLVLVEAGRTTRAGPVAELMADPALAASFGLRDAGALLVATIAAHEADGLSRLDTPAGPLWLPRVAGAPGQALRLRVPASEVVLALSRPEGVSTLNILPVTVTGLVADAGTDGGYGVTVQLMCGGVPLLARVTQRSAAAMGLRAGLQAFALLKALAVAP